jgi:HAD superfamily hydrolase (TIGR01662 family)
MNNIEAILFDVGGPLRDSMPASETARLDAVGRILQRLDVPASPQEFARLLTERFDAYMNWVRETSSELDEAGLWTRWLLPDLPHAQIEPLAMELTRLWRQATGTRKVFPETREAILELFRRGYHLGIVSNTITRAETPKLLQALEIAGCFETIILSCELGFRKPDPAILLEAAHRIGVSPANCAYVGDRVLRDLACARSAGFAAAIIRRGSDFEQQRRDYPDLIADHYVEDLRELLQIFPPRAGAAEFGAPYDASLSTMWKQRNYPQLSDFVEGARRLRFASIELNHELDSTALAGADLATSSICTVHEPCPADIPVPELKQRDWLISSPDEANRQRGVEAVRHSLDLAHRLGLRVVVVHCGMVSGDLTLENQLRGLCSAGLSGSEQYRRLAQELTETRRALIHPCIEAVKKSLRELLDVAVGYHLCLGLENRYHYFDIPSLDEMGQLLTLAPPEGLGFVYDVGHADVLDRLGFYPHAEWLRRYSARIVETHLHDVQGLTDHLAPGRGEVDFDMVARYLPLSAVRTLELRPSNTPDMVSAGLKFLADHGCIHVR